MFEHMLVRPDKSCDVILWIVLESYFVAAPVSESNLLGARLVVDGFYTNTSKEAPLFMDDLELLSYVAHDLSNLVLAPNSLS